MASPTHDVTTTNSVIAPSQAFLSTNHTTTDLCRNGIILITAAAEDTVTPANTAVLSVTVDGNPAIKVDNQSFASGAENVEQWYHLYGRNGKTGLFVVVVTWAGVTASQGVAISSFNNVAQKAPEVTNKATGTGTAITASVTTKSDNSLVYDSTMDASSGSTLTKDADSTERANVTVVGEFKFAASSGLRTPPAADANSWTAGLSHTWGMVIASYAPADAIPLEARESHRRPSVFTPGLAR